MQSSLSSTFISPLLHGLYPPLLGLFVGFAVGPGLGSRVGFGDGTSVGFGVGTGLGSRVGFGDGASVGFGVGTGLGSLVGFGVGASVGNIPEI